MLILLFYNFFFSKFLSAVFIFKGAKIKKGDSDCSDCEYFFESLMVKKKRIKSLRFFLSSWIHLEAKINILNQVGDRGEILKFQKALQEIDILLVINFVRNI